MSRQRGFSRRHGYGKEQPAIRVREDAPREVREAILKIAQSELGVPPERLRTLLCDVLRKVPDRNNWTDFPNIWEECIELIDAAPWYRVYDFVERIYEDQAEGYIPCEPQSWEDLVNEYFLEEGVGWRMVGGVLEAIGTEAFEAAVGSAREQLDAAGLKTAKQEIHEALGDLSRRPEADLTGAVQHAMAALECAMRELVGDPRATLGELIKRHPDVFPKPLDQTLEKLWGFASETGRHLREGRMPDPAEVELVVGTAAVACTYLLARLKTPAEGS